MKILTLIAIASLAIFASACNSNTKSASTTETNTTTSANTIETVAENTSKIEVISPADFDKAVTGNKVQLLDVRSNMEYKKGHLKDAALCDFNGDNFVKEVEALNFDKEAPVYVYCHAGGRSAEAAKILKDLGYKHIFDMDNGYAEWSASNLPTTLD